MSLYERFLRDATQQQQNTHREAEGQRHAAHQQANQSILDVANNGGSLTFENGTLPLDALLGGNLGGSSAASTLLPYEAKPFKLDPTVAADAINAMQTDHFKTKRANLRATNRTFRDELKARKDAALAAQKESNKALADAARATLSGSVSAPISAPALKPLQQITNVALNDDFANGNAATSAFFIPPQSTQSQYAVGAPVGGGNLPPRHRSSSNDVTSSSRKDALGAQTKDEL